MEDKVRIPNLLYKLLINPIKTIKGIDLINYDKDELDRIYYLSAIILGSISVFVRFGMESIGIIFIGLIMFPLSAFIGRWSFSFIYYILFKIVGRIKVTFDIVKTVVYPLVALEFLIRLVSSILFVKFTIATDIIESMLYLWLRFLTSLILVYKFKQPVKKSILLVSILIIFETILFMIGAL